MIKKIFKKLLQVLLAIVIFLSCYGIAVWIGQSVTVNDEFVETPEGTNLYVRSNGAHTDLCISLKDTHVDWNSMLDFKTFDETSALASYITFGWGDKGFYLDTPTWADLKASTAIKAIFLPSSTAMHIAVQGEPSLDKKTYRIQISDDQLKHLEDYIVESFALQQNKAELIDCCRYPEMNDNFYEAKGAYSLFKTCNTWAYNGLKEAGIKTNLWRVAPINDTSELPF